MRRILLLVTDLEIGGTPRVVREIALRLQQAAMGELVVHVACLARRGPVAAEIERGGVPVSTLNANGVYDLSVVARLQHLLGQARVDTVLSFLVHANAVAAATTAMNPAIRYLQAIQTTQPYPKWHWLMQRLIHVMAEAVVVPSFSVARAAQRRSAIPERKIHIIPNAIDLADYPPLDARPPAAPLEVGFIGRLDPVKRVEDLLRAMRQVERGARLHIFGDGPQRPALERLRRTLDVSATFHGIVPRPQDALRQIGLLVLPSLAEGFPLVLIEAMAAGVPIVATAAPGIRDVIEHGATGLLSPPGDPERLAVSIQSMIDDASLRERVRRAAYEDVARRFSWERVLPQYQRLLSPSSRVARPSPDLSYGL